MADKSIESETIFNTLNSSLHQYFALANSNETSQPLYDEIVANEKRYSQGVLIDQGGMKRISKTQDELTGRPVAMATLLTPEDPIKAERFLREARLTAALEHPNIIPVYDIGLNEDEAPFFTMKLITGKSLKSIISEQYSSSQGKRLSLHELLDIFIKICDAISYAHSKGVLHLDLKPANIQIGEYGEVLICDWGLAKVIDSPDEAFSGDLDPCIYNDITLDGVIKGTPGFMAPEQIDQSIATKNQQTDTYALGGILYALLTGRPPVDFKEVQETLDETLKGSILQPSSLNPAIPLSLEAVIMKALRSKQNERYQSVFGLRSDIHKWLGGFATAAENAGFLKAAWLLLKRHKTVTAFMGIIILSTVSFFIKIRHSEKVAIEALSLYEEEKKQTQIIGREASPRLVYLAKQALDGFEYDNAIEIINRAIDRDPKNLVAYGLRGQIQFYRQEFNQAYESFNQSKKFKKNYLVYYDLTKKYKSMKSDEDLLPSKEFITLLKIFENKEDIYKLYRFETGRYTSLDDHIKTVFYMLQHNNPQVENWKFKFSYTDEATILDISGNLNMSNIACLRELPIDILNISNTEVWENRVIEQLPLRELNIVNTKFDSINGILKIPTLETIYIDTDKWTNIKTSKRPHLKIIREEG
jgi:eukaryotic-like serine/threonine-protein kinase